MMTAERGGRTDGHRLRYAQCWEDADVLLEALDIQPGHVCLSIASGGDNTLAMLSRRPERVIAVDRNPAQIACLELKVAAYRRLEYEEVRELLGSLPSCRRERLYRHLRPSLSADARRFWDARPEAIGMGIGEAGKFEGYFRMFRGRVLPLVHSRERVVQLLLDGTQEVREAFYDAAWDTRRWRLVFQAFFSRLVMGCLGRDPGCFRYVEGGVARHLLARTRHALTALNPADNPYVQWILLGRHATALPCALRPDRFAAIRANLDRLEWHCSALEDWLASHEGLKIDRYNLSDIFEYMSAEAYRQLLKRLVFAGRPGGRLAYWNLLAERRRPAELGDRLDPIVALAERLHARDRAFFYGDFVLEEIR
jgi:S-adenosylmethionine-diacylglycerol 3-amino-3-carboxypropyl transferase